MLTAERAGILARVAGGFPLLGSVTEAGLLELVGIELGHPQILDGFRPYGGHLSRAFPKAPILHVVSGNTPHAGLQSLLRGLLVGAHNRVKIPTAGLPELTRFVKMLPRSLRELVEISGELPAEWMQDCGVWIVFGSDETVAHFRRLAPAGVDFIPHPHRLSFGMVFDDAGAESAPFAARDVSLFNQKGCLSPHDIYVAGDAKKYAERLACEMQRFQEREPRSPVSPHEAAQIADMRANYRFRAASDSRVQLWESEGSTAWTVIYEDDPWFAASCLNRLVFVKPLPADPAAALNLVKPWVAGIGIWPPTVENANHAALLGPSRICPLGRMQEAPLTWHQEGNQVLNSLVRWVDFESEIR